MRRILSLFVIGFSLTLTSSCSKWLDVQPKSEIKSEVMFETEQGFKDALIGCYVTMSGSSLYGREMTQCFMEVVANQYDYVSPTSNSYYNLGYHLYSTYSDITDAMWTKMYNAIANVNNVIENLETHRDILTPTAYHIFKGEAYGLRAFLHFDLLRMFSAGDLRNTPENINRIAIPYSDRYYKLASPQYTTSEVLDMIESDIDTSIESLKGYDTYCFDSPYAEDRIVMNDDLFFRSAGRSFHFNYKAAKFLKMRMLMWKGDDESRNSALMLASDLIEMAELQWISDEVINATIESSRDLCFSSEKIFAVETFERFDNVITPCFSYYSVGQNLNAQCFYLTGAKAESLFEVDVNIGTSDYRYTRQLAKQGENYVIIKFHEYEGHSSAFTDVMPLMRTSEVYLTAAEILNDAGGDVDRGLAIDYLNELRMARGIASNHAYSDDLTTEEISTEIEKEWRKEFISEGQLFFFYKRKGYSVIPGGTSAGTDNTYMFPIPENEIENGRIDPILAQN